MLELSLVGLTWYMIILKGKLVVKKNVGFTQSFYKSIIAVVFMFSFSYANAGIIESELILLGGNTYQYNFNIINDDLPTGLEEFSIYFDYTLYENLVNIASPADWDIFIADPDVGATEDGFYDGLFLVSPLAFGASLSGFSVSFDWLGATLPPMSGNFFEIFNANFDVLGSGFTRVAGTPPNKVPEPNIFSLFVLAFIIFKNNKKRLTRL
jgi:hypothetical protein